MDMQQLVASIPANALSVFKAYAKDSGNWNGTPLWGGNVAPVLGEKEDRALLTKLKIAGLVSTFKDDGSLWLDFTPLGKEVAQYLGINI